MPAYPDGAGDALEKLGLDKEAFWGLLARGAAAAARSPWASAAWQAIKNNKLMVGVNALSGWNQGGDSTAGKLTSSLAHGALGAAGMKGMVGSMGLGAIQERFRGPSPAVPAAPSYGGVPPQH